MHHLKRLIQGGHQGQANQTRNGYSIEPLKDDMRQPMIEQARDDAR